MQTGTALPLADDAARESPDDEAAAVERACADSVTFEVLYRRYRDRIYWYLRARTQSDEDAADLAQHVFVHALGALRHYQERRGTVAAWLFGIARHAATDWHRRQRATVAWEYLPEALHPDDGRDVEADTLRRESLARLRPLLAALPRDKRELLALRNAGGLTIPEIAAVVGKSVLSAQALSIAKPGADGVADLSSRYVQVGQEVLAYNPELRDDNTILLSSRAQTRAFPSWALPNDVFDGASVAQSLSTLAQESPQQVRLLPRQTLDGVTVDVIEVDGWTQAPAQRTTLYFDAQSYVLRGFDATSLAPSYPTPSWQARLNSETTMPASVVPPQTFALGAPATAIVVPLDLGGPAFSTVTATVAATCHGAANVKELLRSGQSLLAACRDTAPDVTAAALVAALAAPDRAALGAAAAAGVLTSAQAAAYLDQVQAQLTAWVTAPPSAGTAAPTPGTPGT